MGVVGLVLLSTACAGGGDENAESENGEPVSLSENTSEEPLEAEILPEDGATEVRPDTPITVTTDTGTISNVDVTQTGDEQQEESPADEITGSLNDDETEWISDWTLIPGSDVTVTATIESEDGESTEVVSEFGTLPAPAGQRLGLQSNFPISDSTVGVGMPVIINFDRPVQHKERLESAVEVVSEEPARGAWNWFGDQTMVFRPEEFWEPYQRITVDMHLAGVEAADGVYGAKNYRLDFEVGRSQIGRIDTTEHQMTVERDGQQVKEFPTSVGKATTEAYTTTSGTHLTMEKYDELTMDSSTVGVPVDSPEGYKLDVEYAVRFSNSGEFTHAAPWNDQLGEENLSHGCPNLSTGDAKWYYKNSFMGDPLIIEGTDRELEVDNGWGYWQRSWDEWLANSTLGEADATDEPGTPGSPHGRE